MSLLLLTAHEARVIAALTEKSITTPAYYPMTVNGLMAACNQKSSREPVMTLTEGEVGHALTTLEEKGLTGRDDSSARATKWRQKFQHHLLLKTSPFAVVLALMLRGPQTAAELRASAAALNGPLDGDGLAVALRDLADRAQPLVVQLPRSSGQAAPRFAHTLCGAPEASQFLADDTIAAATERVGSSERNAALEIRILRLEEQLAALEQRLTAAGA